MESLLKRGEDLEKRFEWNGAAEAYLEAAALLQPTDLLQFGNIEELAAHARYRYAFQAETSDEFNRRAAEAIRQYTRAKEAYNSLRASEAAPWIHRCSAMMAYIALWSEPDPSEKRRLMSQTWQLAKQAMDAFQQAGDGHQFAKTNNVLTFVVSIAYAYAEDIECRERLIREGLEYSEKAVKLLSETEDKVDLAKSYVNASYYTRLFCSDFVRIEERDEWDKRSGELIRKGLELSKEEIIDTLTYTYKFGVFPSTLTPEENVSLRQSAFQYATQTKDKLRLASVYEWTETKTYVEAHEAADPDLMYSKAQEMLDLAERSKSCYSLFSSIYPSESACWSGSPRACFYATVSTLETDLAKKRDLALKGVPAFEEELKIAEECDYPEAMAGAQFDATMILASLAKTERNPEEKKKILERALKHARLYMNIWQSIHPQDFGIAEGKIPLAEMEHELAGLAIDADDKINLYRDAITHLREAYERWCKETNTAAAVIQRWMRLRLGLLQYQIGDWSIHMHEVSRERDDLVSAASAFQKAIEMYANADQPSRLAESYWKAAQAEDALGDFKGASERFMMASSSYRRAAESLPKLSTLYHEYSLYMQAWSQIEMARHHHARQEPGSASECYERASQLHESTEKWRFLAPNYKAWAHVEKGEDLSRREKSKEAMASFEDAGRLFEVAKEHLSGELERTHAADERESITRLIKAADLRREYCAGRLALEEAKILDREGDELGSCDKFAFAASTFEKLKSVLESDQDRRETDLIMILSRAWQTMAKAEAESSPELYEEAARTFEQARDQSVGERAKLLAMGHSRFCRALAAGTQFADSGDSSLHTVAIQNLESAAKHYLKAGLENDSEYARASKLLFDAYVYMDKASKEEDQTKKAKLYEMTEKVLESSAASYSKAEYPRKKDQVLKLLERVKVDRELAVALMEVLHAPDAIASTTALPTPIPTRETAAGMQRFEQADLQAMMFARPKDLHVGADLSVELEFVNAGRGAAQLARVERILPEGFEFVAGPDTCRIEEGCLNMRGRRLDALKTEDVKIVLKPTHKGRFVIRPRIMYLDESGVYKFCEPVPVEVSVKELGISGWIKGRE